jgi:hypothetical protein
MTSCRSDDCRNLRQLSATDHIGAMAQATKGSDSANGCQRASALLRQNTAKVGRIGWVGEHRTHRSC